VIFFASGVQSAEETGRLRGWRFWEKKPYFTVFCPEEDGASNGLARVDLR